MKLNSSDARFMAQLSLGMITSTATSFVVEKALNNVLPMPESISARLAYSIGIGALSGIACGKVYDQTTKEVDFAFDFYEEFKEAISKLKKIEEKESE